MMLPACRQVKLGPGRVGVLMLSLLAGAPPFAEAAGRKVLILVPEHRTFLAAAEACREVLEHDGCAVTLLRTTPDATPAGGGEAVPASQPASASQPAPATPALPPALRSGLLDRTPDLVVAFGEPLALGALTASPATPLVHVMVSNVLDSPLAEPGAAPRRIYGVSMDFGPADQLKWIRLLQPRAAEIGLLHSARSQKTAAAIQAAGTAAGVRVQLLNASRDDFAKAVNTLTASRCEAVLMIADSQVYTPASVKRLLLWGIRQQKAVYAFSQNFVDAGALAALCSDPAAIGRQAAQLAGRVLSGAVVAPGTLEYAQPARRVVNLRTAKMIDLRLGDDVLRDVTIVGREE
jgi:ABC-type uncharacterized transport system substrate-binding protein